MYVLTIFFSKVSHDIFQKHLNLYLMLLIHFIHFWILSIFYVVDKYYLEHSFHSEFFLT